MGLSFSSCFEEIPAHGCSAGVEQAAGKLLGRNRRTATPLRAHDAGRIMSQRAAGSSPLLLLIAYMGFISLGLPDTLIGVAWPSVRDHFHLPPSAAAFLFFGAGCSYFLSSFFTGRLLQVIGIGMLLALSSALVALSGFGFGLAPLWVLFAACSLLHGLGSGAIDAGLNHYVAHHFSAKQMNRLHACYALGTTLGPLIMTGAIAWQGSWRLGYLTVATILLTLALLFALTRRNWDAPAGHQEPSAGGEKETAALGLQTPCGIRRCGSRSSSSLFIPTSR